jgi:seryl-tRNA synthetase
MLDPKILRENLPLVAESLKKRQKNINVEIFTELDKERKTLQAEVEKLQNIRNTQSKAVGLAKAKGEDIQLLLAEVSDLGEQLKTQNDRLQQVQEKLREFSLTLPNIVHSDIAIGKDHVDLGSRELGLDMEAGTKLSGARFVVLKDKIARLHRALAQFMLDLHTTEHGYTEINVPYIVNLDILEGTGQLPNMQDDLFYTEGESQQMGLIPTSEVSLTNLVRDEIYSSFCLF